MSHVAVRRFNAFMTKAEARDPSFPFTSVVRSKGFVWLAPTNDMSWEWGHAGSLFRLDGGQPWFASIPRDEWPGDEGTHAEIQADFDADPAIGDRRQEIVVIGIGFDRAAIERELDACLLTDAEYASGAEAWATMPNPFQFE
eukprot:Opistho-1_new@87754